MVHEGIRAVANGIKDMCIEAQHARVISGDALRSKLSNPMNESRMRTGWWWTRESPARSDELRTGYGKFQLVLRIIGTPFLLLFSFGCSAELPRETFDTQYRPPVGEVIQVAAGGDLQGALDAANPGDVVELEAGATYIGNYTLPEKSGTDWIHIRSSAYEDLPLPGKRVTEVDAPSMPKIVTPNGAPAIRTLETAHHYRFVGIEIRPAVGLFASNLILLGSGQETSEARLPHHIIFDRSYIRGDPTEGTRRGIAMNGRYMAVIDSYMQDFKDLDADSQAIAGWNGSGPFKIVNNYLEAAGENVLFGGADPKIDELVPSDIEIRHNHFFKPLSWKIDDPSYEGDPWKVKNLFELKNARRVLITGNVFEHNWPHAQNGFGILFTVRNQGGTAPWSVVEDVTFVHNIVRHMHSGINILGHDDIHPSKQTKRIEIRDNLFQDINGEKWGDGSGRLFQILAGAAAIRIEHNTAFQDGPITMADGAPTTGLIHRGNLTMEGHGVIGSGTAVGIDTLNTYFPDAEYYRNVQIGGNELQYPSGNHFPATVDEVGFEDWAEGQYRLVDDSPYKKAGVNGKDIGADFDALEAETMGAVEGISPARAEEDGQLVHCHPCAWQSIERPMFSSEGIISAAEKGASVVFDFIGTAVQWIGYRDEWSGIANVYLDGAFQSAVDTYGSPSSSREVMFSRNGLSDQPHRLVIEVAGEHSSSSDGSWVSVDAFDVESESGIARFEEGHSSVNCNPCGWYAVASSTLSAGEARAAVTPGASVHFDFVGTGVSWIGYRDEWSGIAKVYLDGILQKEVDTHAPVDEPQAVLFSNSDLEPGPHRLAVEVTGTRNPDSQGSWIWIDAFESLP